MKQWHMTVGYPGGELVSTDRDLVFEAWYTPVSGVERGKVIIRPCPPDLAEWLDTAMYQLSSDQGMKVPGGWIFVSNGGACFVPVAGAAGITILEANDEHEN